MATGLAVLMAVLAGTREIEGELSFHSRERRIVLHAPKDTTSLLNRVFEICRPVASNF